MPSFDMCHLSLTCLKLVVLFHFIACASVTLSFLYLCVLYLFNLPDVGKAKATCFYVKYVQIFAQRYSLSILVVLLPFLLL